MAKKKTKTKSNIFMRLLKIIIILGVIGGIVFFLYKKDNNFFSAIVKNEGSPFEEVKKPKLKILNEESKERPVAVVFDNNTNAWSHSGLPNAYAIYEFPVEGGESRVLAFFKDKKDIPVGPIRSARHYFLDYILEHDAIFAHIGQSPKAGSDIETLGISDINGQHYDTGMPKGVNNTEYWRISNKMRPHNSYSDITNLKNISDKKGFKKETDAKVPFKYSVVNIDLDKEKSKKITSLTGAYHAGNKTVFNYNEDTKMYTKTAKGVLQLDEITGKPLEVKNIVILKAPVSQLPDIEKKDRKDVKTTGTMNGIYSTNGRVMEINAVKDSRSSKTRYQDKDGNEIVFNDGITFIMIIPENAPSFYEYNEIEEAAEVQENN